MNIFSAIIKGPKKNELQDALGITNKKQYSLLVIADGLGSAQHSSFGAKKTVQAVQQAIFQWRELEKKDAKVLIQLIHFNWNLLINDSQYEKKECSSTCLFSYLDKINKTLILGQLGDGLIIMKSKEETTFLRSTDDYNFTKSLGSSKSYTDWNIKETEYDAKKIKLFMSSDGISEDLVTNKEDEFLEELIKNLKMIKRNKRNGYLHNLLINWPTKFHTDDKSICIAWEKKK